MAQRSVHVVLTPVDEDVLEELVQAATTDAAADEVTPRLTASTGAWTPPRVAWLRSFHRDRRAGLSGAAAEATWAVVVDDQVVGSVRLKRLTDESMLEVGAWLTRAARGHGVGRAAAAAVLREAGTVGARAVRAQTTNDNAAAQTVLERLGFDLQSGRNGRDVEALLLLQSVDTAGPNQ